jgi:hypothetical protein
MENSNISDHDIKINLIELTIESRKNKKFTTKLVKYLFSKKKMDELFFYWRKKIDSNDILFIYKGGTTMKIIFDKCRIDILIDLKPHDDMTAVVCEKETF